MFSPSRDFISKPIDDVHDTDVPAPWPAECALSDLVLTSRDEAERHREHSGRGDVMVQATDRDLELDELMRAVNE
jgi:hypothetical protein